MCIMISYCEAKQDVHESMYVISMQAAEEVPDGWLGWADSDPVGFCFFLCSNLPFQTARLQVLLEATDVVHRLRCVSMLCTRAED